jgi:hypothetical protein
LEGGHGGRLSASKSAALLVPYAPVHGCAPTARAAQTHAWHATLPVLDGRSGRRWGAWAGAHRVTIDARNRAGPAVPTTRGAAPGEVTMNRPPLRNTRSTSDALAAARCCGPRARGAD